MKSLLAAALLLIISCRQPSVPVPVAQGACTTSLTLADTTPPTTTPPTTTPPTTTPPAATTTPVFKDVLEILNSNTSGRIYKCTVCHATFKIYDVVADPMKFTQILDSMNYASSPANPMPRGGDSMTDADIATLKAWAAANYPETTTSKKAATTSTTPKTAPTDDGSVTGKPSQTTSTTGC